MKKITVGVLAIQGDVSEHVFAMEKVFKKKSTAGSVLLVKQQHDIDVTDALIIPGGESTTISNILMRSGLYTAISNRIEKHTLPIMGTCAGAILLAKKLHTNPQKIKTFRAMDIKVARNAFGRQNDSFEKPITFDEQDVSLNAIFIRAPHIVNFWGTAKSLAEIDGQTIAVHQNEFLALSFHPELTDDLRVHEYFLKMICNAS